MRKKTVAIVFAMMLLATLALPGTASAHPAHQSCKDYGQRISSAAQEFGGVGDFRSEQARLDDGSPGVGNNIARAHDRRCDT